MSATPTPAPNLVQIRYGGLLCKLVKYNKFLFIYTPLWELIYRSDSPTDFRD